MSSARVVLLATSFSCVIAAHGCGEDDRPPPEDTEQVCAPRTVYTCFRSGCRGYQTCSANGKEMSACLCSAEEPEDSGVPADAAERDASEPSGGPERCDDDRDDDADGDVDCADTECGSRSCERLAGDGFQGPIALRRSQDGMPDCEAPWESPVFEAGESPQAAAASCEECACEPAEGSCAAFVDFGTGTEAACGGTTCTTSVNQSCVEIMPPCIAGASTAYLATKLPSAAGGCKPSAATPSKPEVTWARRVIGCAAAPPVRGGCSASEVCLPEPTAGDAGDVMLCVWREGEHDCPSSRYTERQVYHRALNDTRGCSACTCSGSSCSYGWSVFNAGDTSCATPIVRLTSADQCVQVNPSADRLRVGATITGDGACTAGGGQSEGAVSGTDPVSVCCRR